MTGVLRSASVGELRTMRADIEERLVALVDSQHHGLEASKFCRNNADREFTKHVIDDLKVQIRELRGKLKTLQSC